MKLPTIVRQVAGEESAAAGGTESAKRKTVSKRDFIDASGVVVDKIEEATGSRYVLLDPATPGGHVFDYQFGTNPALDKMACIFGLQTKIGNVANTVLNDKDEPGTPADAAAAINEWLNQPHDSFTWAERAGGVGGARVDKQALAAAIVAVAEATPSKSWTALIAAGKTPDEARGDLFAIAAKRLEEEAGYMRSVRAIPAVASEYTARVGKQTKTIDELI